MSKIEGHVTRAYDVSPGESALHEFSGVPLDSGQRIIRGTGMDTDALTGWVVFEGDFTRGDLQYVTYYQANANVSGAKILGHGMTIIHESGSSTDRTQCGQFHVIVQSGATISSRSGDSNAGIHNIHGKVQGDAGATWASGCRVAPFWSDIQINTVDVSAEEVWHFFASAGGSRARALIRMEDQIALRFLESDGALGEGFYATSGYDSTQNNDPAGWLTINVGGTAYGIPIMATS